MSKNNHLNETEFVAGDEVIPRLHSTLLSVPRLPGARSRASTIVEVKMVGEPMEIAIMS